ncbi:MAG TPA: GNAT family N-acetyltransferase [Candidatus Limnocylindrales bacterium]|nr:GNAT family N-acetyltransferase [Candidatus Limnocylindrales bacterium]
MHPRLPIRLADPDRDAAAVAGIYRSAVEGSTISFEETAPDASEMADRIRRTLLRTPWLVAMADADEVVGYAYAGQHRDRAGYRWSVDISAYVHPDWRGRGVGRTLYDTLLPILVRQGFVNVYAGIALPNPASVALHQSIGMQLVGVYERVGYKLGEWLDVAWYGKRLAEPADPPAEPIALAELAQRSG